ncbi:hypothetical protein GGR57DRAFT_459297 [Xylariaceae sp. FL1272]|nr:hypothetical protein GGR57DRAFT_459297 [Xylariaceae sp. FL1272]
MCFTSSDRNDDPPNKPTHIPHQQGSTSSRPPASRASMPQDYAPPSGPPPSQQRPQAHAASADDFVPPSGPPPSQSYAPPSGPPPSHDYEAPSGPPPTHGNAGPLPSKTNNPFFDSPPGPPPPQGGQASSYAPPPGPPPSHDYTAPPGPPPSQDYGPPSGPPPSQNKQHDWETAVPDTALLPPPPMYFGEFERSPANNATEAEAEEALQWCRRFKMTAPIQLDAAALSAVEAGNINMFAPTFYSDHHNRGTFGRKSVGVWEGQATKSTRDTCLASYPPLYSVFAHSPMRTRRRKTIYYEVTIKSFGKNGPVLAIGLLAPPYPPFRLPGWQRGSLGIHGDDGHKYINDHWGGLDCTSPFKRGDTVGIGMHFDFNHGRNEAEVFFTRNGTQETSWNINEDVDSKTNLTREGLEGYHDICAAVGVSDEIAFEIVFVPELWRWQGWRANRG